MTVPRSAEIPALLVRDELDRVVKSAAFARADRLKRFRRFVVEQTLEGRQNDIKESTIALDVCGRDPTFDAKVDAIAGVTVWSSVRCAIDRSAPKRSTYFIASFLPRRAASIQYVRETTDALHDHVAPLGALGDLDAYQWLRLLATHTERHIQQIEDVKEAVKSSA